MYIYGELKTLDERKQYGIECQIFLYAQLISAVEMYPSSF